MPGERDPANSKSFPRPYFLREIEQRGNEIGLIDAVHELLERDNITVNIEGDDDRLEAHEGGILFAGDHKNQWEFVALMDMLSRIGRDELLHIAKFYVQRQVRQALGGVAAQQILPVYPRVLASNRGEFFNSETLNRVVYRRHLLSEEESAAANESTLQTATDFLGGGGAVNIFPCGSVVDARTHPWRSGIGRIIRQLPEEGRGDILVAPYGLEDVSRLRLVGAVAVRGRGLLGRSQSIDMDIGPLHTAEEIVASLPKSDRDNPDAITERLRQQFIEHFGQRLD